MWHEKKSVSQWLEKWAASEVPPLLSSLAKIILKNNDLLNAVCSVKSVPPFLAFMAAIHERVLQGEAPTLARHYPSVGGLPNAETLEKDFLDEVLPRLGDLVHRASLQTVQTNEPRRAAVVPFLLSHLHQRTGETRCSLLELGASAGFNLLYDEYSYHFQSPAGGQVGSLHGNNSEPLFDVEWLSAADLNASLESYKKVEVVWRQGLDMSPNPSFPWLEALVWPEEDRIKNFRKTVQIRKKFPSDLVVAADFTQSMDSICVSAPENSAFLIFAPFTLYQLTPELRTKVLENVSKLSHSRQVFFSIVDTSLGEPDAILWYEFLNGKMVEKTALGNCHFHMKWIDIYREPKKGEVGLRGV